MNKIIAVVLIILFAYGCEPALKVVCYVPEESDDLLFFFPERGSVCPKDTAIWFNKDKLRQLSHYSDDNGYERYVINLGLGTWDTAFREWKTDTVSFFLFDKKIVNEHTWEVVQESYLALQRYDLTKKDLNNLHGLLYYPPTREMSGMKMWPRYEDIRP